MPIKIKSGLPAIEVLAGENIFVMDEDRALSQHIRPLRILLLNLMPKKIETETQLLRLLGNTPLQIDVTFLKMESYTPTNTPSDHMETFYRTFEEIKDDFYDGMIITGAPVETLEFEEVLYWEELVKIMNWSEERVFSTLHICWGAQAALYHFYGIQKYPLDEKLFGIFEHQRMNSKTMLMRGFDEFFAMPQSRHTYNKREDIEAQPELELLAWSSVAGVGMVRSRDNKNVFITGHSEYDRLTLENEYKRDLSQGKPIEMPVNYYPNNDVEELPHITWRAHANLLFTNWLNYYVYQETPFDIEKIKELRSRLLSAKTKHMDA